MKYEFVQLLTFTAKAKKNGLSVEDIRQIELVIQSDAKAAPVMAGTNGLRKMRFAPEVISGGKSGGIRVCYVVIEEVAHVYLVTLFAKSEKANLDADERNVVSAVIARIKKAHQKKEKS